YFDAHEQRKSMCSHIVRRDRMPLFVSQIWIRLAFEKRFSKRAVWLVHFDYWGSFFIRSPLECKRASSNDLHIGSFQNVQQCVASTKSWRVGRLIRNNVSEHLPS